MPQRSMYRIDEKWAESIRGRECVVAWKYGHRWPGHLSVSHLGGLAASFDDSPYDSNKVAAERLTRNAVITIGEAATYRLTTSGRLYAAAIDRNGEADPFCLILEHITYTDEFHGDVAWLIPAEVTELCLGSFAN